MVDAVEYPSSSHYRLNAANNLDLFIYIFAKIAQSHRGSPFFFCFKVNQQAAKCIPSMVCPELTEQIRREIAASLHQRKGDFACYFLPDLVTFTLPAGIYHDMFAQLTLLAYI